nr:MAG: peroxidase [Chloroflexota bacterium]
MLGDRALVDAVLDDYTTAPCSEQERALFHLIAKIVEDSTQIRQADIDEAKAAGWSEEALYDAITVCALFQFYNTWIDATGVHDLPAAVYDAMGKRMAAHGYAPPEE